MLISKACAVVSPPPVPALCTTFLKLADLSVCIALQGHFQIVLNNDHCPLFQKDLSWFQRLMYCSGVWAYIVGAITTPMFIIIPLVSLTSLPTPTSICSCTMIAQASTMRQQLVFDTRVHRCSLVVVFSSSAQSCCCPMSGSYIHWAAYLSVAADHSALHMRLHSDGFLQLQFPS